MAEQKEPWRYIDLQVRNLDAFFNTMDPSPLRERDLSDAADEFIVGWAREIPITMPIKLRIHFAEKETEDHTAMLREAVHHYFMHRREMTALEFRALMRQARTSLLIGTVFLTLCLLAGNYLLTEGHGTFFHILRESLVIAGWVAMWRPIQLYLYDWWPLRQRRHLYEKLSKMPIEVA